MGIFGNFTGLLGGRSKADAASAETFRKLQHFLRNQIDTLGREGQRVHFNEITIGYISHLVMMITKKPASISVVHHALISIFTDKASLVMINNALQIFSSDEQTEEKLAALFPIAKKEYEAGSGEFLIRHSRKAHKEIEAMFSERHFDPRDVPQWTANDLA